MRIKIKILHNWTKLRLQPIRVFCMHHVCSTLNIESMNVCDWMHIDEFKRKVKVMQQEGIEFISLSVAYHKIKNDIFRTHKYAVLTFDDGYASLKEILPWLAENHIPATLFINGKYLDGKSFRANSKEKYLTKKELFQLSSPLIEIGSHGWEHIDASQMGESAFTEYIEKNIQVLSQHPCFIPFHAYTWGKHTKQEDNYLHSMGYIPVLVDGKKNYNARQYIYREILQ